MSEKLNLPEIQAYIRVKEACLNSIIQYENCKFEVEVKQQEPYIIKVIDKLDSDSYFMFQDFKSLGYDVSVKIRLYPSRTLQNTVSVETHQVGLAIQLFQQWARNRDTYHELFQKEMGDNFSAYDSEANFIKSWQLTEEDEVNQFELPYKDNLIGYSKFIEGAVLESVEISEDDKKEFSQGIQYFQQEVNVKSKAQVVKSLAKIMEWVRERSVNSFKFILNGAANYLLEKGLDVAVKNAPTILRFIEYYIKN